MSVRSGMLALALLGALPAVARPGPVRVDVARAGRAAEVSERFVSFAVDIDQLVGGTFWDPAGGAEQVRAAPYDFTRPRLRRLAGALAPAYLRLGGSAADQTYYDPSDAPVATPPPPYEEVLTRVQWDGAMAFARALGLEVVLTLNAGAGPRDASAVWTDTNARQLLTYVAARGDPVAVLEWGNEPNLFAIRAGVPGYTAADYARDFAAVRALRDAVLPRARLAGPGTIYTRTLDDNIVGTIAFGPRLGVLLPLVGSAVDMVTYHYYAAISTRCPTLPRVTPATALETAYLDGIDEPVAAVGTLRDAHAPGAPVWLMESGGQSCGGQPGVADAFLDSFWYLNTLARLARAGHEVFVRQTLSGASYGLLDEVTLAPRPDYWAALLWRRLMGRTALASPPLRRGTPALRTYAHCQRDGRPGAVTLLALNTGREAAVRLRVRARGRAHPMRVYLVTAPAVAGQEVRLNGVALEATADGTPPPLRARRRRGTISLPPVSYAFVVVPAAGACACRPCRQRVASGRRAE